MVESIPEGLIYDPDSPSFLSTFDAWDILIKKAKKTIFIGSFYWTLRSGEVANHSSSIYGDKIFNALLAAGTERKIDIRIAQNIPTQVSPNIDTEILQKRKAAKVRSVDFNKLIGGGVLHSKVIIILLKMTLIKILIESSTGLDYRQSAFLCGQCEHGLAVVVSS